MAEILPVYWKKAGSARLDDSMAYFLKTTHYKKGDYIQIYFSFRDPETRQPRNRCWKTLGYIQDLQASGIADPVSYYKEEVRRLNEERRQKQELARNPLSRKISDLGAARTLGYFPFQAVWNQMEMDSFFEDLTRTRMRFNAARCIHDLVMAKAVDLQARRNDFTQGLGLLWKNTDWTSEQTEACLDLLGKEADRIIRHVSACQDAQNGDQTMYLGWTTYYMDAFPQDSVSGTSAQESPEELALDLGITLNSRLIPSSLFLSTPVRKAEDEVHSFHMPQDENSSRPYVRVADKLLNDPREIFRAVQNQDGYIYSRSMDSLSAAERAWVFEGANSLLSLQDSGKPVVMVKTKLEDTPYSFEQEDGEKAEFVSRERRTVIYIPSLALQEKKEIRQQKEQALEALSAASPLPAAGRAGRYLKKNPDTGELQIDHGTFRRDLQSAGFRLIVTTDISRPAMDSVMTYAELWRMKEILLAHKVSLEENLSARRSVRRLQGSFLVCFLAMLLERKARVELLEDRFSAEEFDQFVSGFHLVEKLPGHCINLAENSRVLSFLETKTGLPLSDYELNEQQTEKILSLKIPR